MNSRLIATVLVLSTAIMASRLIERRTPGSLAKPLPTIPTRLDGFLSQENPPIEDRVLHKLLPTSYLSRTYSQGSRQIDLFIAYYAQQKTGESMHSPKHCLPGAGWEIWNSAAVNVSVQGNAYKLNRYYIQSGGARMQALYWYQNKNRIFASEYLGKLLLVHDALLHDDASGSLVRLIYADNPEMSEVSTRFASGLIPYVQDCFGQRF
jgi:EpsI family protein